MNGVSSSRWRTWFICWDILLAFLAGVVVFAALDVVSGGLALAVLTTGIALAVVGLGHYFFWGRVFKRHLGPEANGQIRVGRRSTPVPDDEIVLGLVEQERLELLRLLEQSLAAIPQAQNGKTDNQRARLDRQLADKLRMFGA